MQNNWRNASSLLMIFFRFTDIFDRIAGGFTFTVIFIYCIFIFDSLNNIIQIMILRKIIRCFPESVEI